MKHDSLSRGNSGRPAKAVSQQRPRPTMAAALLFASLLSVPFLVLAVAQLVF
ncbi:hypothetical protein [Pelagimonas varians]|uniref:hypothetical protein n=1 Tax=Pelagimonas varians TaxID=696760 RepID=UPI001474B055|nr:hypothetical protein [Pelagimonas varians]